MDYAPPELVAAIADVDWSAAAAEDPMRAFSSFQALASQFEEGSAGWAAFMILAKASGMMLKPERWDQPYAPLIQFDDRRTALPEDFADDELEFLATILPSLPSTLVGAQIADLLFLRVSDKNRRFDYAKETIARWADLGLPEGLHRSEERGWRRAVEIALRFHQHEDVERLVGAAVERIRENDGRVAWRVAQGLRESGAGREHAAEVAAALLDNSASVQDLHLRREILGEAQRWMDISGDDAAASKIGQTIGDLWWDEAKSRRSESHFIARDFYGNAYNQYRSVKRALRSGRTSKRLARLPRKIREEGLLSLDEMQSIESDPIDLSPLREVADKVAAEEDTVRALAMWFANVPLEGLDAARKAAEDAIQEHPIQHLVTRTTIDSEGRTVQKAANAQDRGGIPAKVWGEMVNQLSLKIGLLAQGYIWPVLVTLSTQRKLTPGDFRVMAGASAFVPPDQEWFFATALYNGYYGRLAESIYMLAPTMEACVRAYLQRAGIETRNIRSDDTETEPGLSALMELEGVDEALTPDLAWHIRALYCGPLGPNLRNRVAHGLLTEDESKGGYVLFAWWLALRLAFIPYFNLTMRSEEAAAAASDSVGDDSESGQTPPLDDSKE